MPVEVAATIDVSSDELADRGFDLREPVWDGTWDEPGPVDEVALRLADGIEVLLVRHLGNPQIGVEIRAPLDAEPEAICTAVLEGLGLPKNRRIWIRPKGVWDDLRRLYARKAGP